MSLHNHYNFEYLENETERLVIDELEEQLKNNKEVCKCQDCVLDMAAYALNKAKPYYRVSLMGKLYASTIDDSKYLKEIKKGVKEAIKKIQDNPSHN